MSTPLLFRSQSSDSTNPEGEVKEQYEIEMTETLSMNEDIKTETMSEIKLQFKERSTPEFKDISKEEVK